jgi:hypothetical protein
MSRAAQELSIQLHPDEYFAQTQAEQLVSAMSPTSGIFVELNKETNLAVLQHHGVVQFTIKGNDSYAFIEYALTGYPRLISFETHYGETNQELFLHKAPGNVRGYFTRSTTAPLRRIPAPPPEMFRQAGQYFHFAAGLMPEGK